MGEFADPPKPAPVPDTITVVRYRCETCQSGELRATDCVYTSIPPKFQHICEGCGAGAILDRSYPYTQVNHRTADEPTHHERLLGDALGKVLVAVGMIRADALVSGPELLLAAEDFCREPNAEFAKTVIQVGAKVERDDGRFYVPLMRSAFRVQDARSLTVARVASDAFDNVGEAERFALDLATAWNHTYRHFD